MEAGFIVLVFVIAAFSVAIGFILGVSAKKNANSVTTSMGVVHVDRSDPAGGPWLYLEATTTIEEIATQKQVTFDVNVVK